MIDDALIINADPDLPQKVIDEVQIIMEEVLSSSNFNIKDVIV